MTANNEYLFYLNNKCVYDVHCSTMRDLVKDAFTIYDITTTLSRDRVKGRLLNEYDDCLSILEAVRHEVHNRLHDMFADDDNFWSKQEEINNDDSCEYIEWLHIRSIDSVHKSHIRYMFWDLYMLYDFFNVTGKPTDNKRNKLNEYLYCEKMKDAIERTLYVRLTMLYGK